MVLLSKCTGDSGTTHPVSELLVTSGECPRALQPVKQGAQVVGADQDRGEEERENLQCGAADEEAVYDEALEIQPAPVLETKAHKCSRASRWS